MLYSCRTLKANIEITGFIDIPYFPASDLSPCTHFTYLILSVTNTRARKLARWGNAPVRLIYLYGTTDYNNESILCDCAKPADFAMEGAAEKWDTRWLRESHTLL